MYVTGLARSTGVSPDTVRYYAKIGLLKPQRDPDNAYQVYGDRDVRRLRFIRAAKSVGFTLADIRAFFDDAERSKSPCPRVRALVERRIEETERRLAELTTLLQTMVQAVEAWEGMPDSYPTGDSVCALIESLEDLTLERH